MLSLYNVKNVKIYQDYYFTFGKYFYIRLVLINLLSFRMYYLFPYI